MKTFILNQNTLNQARFLIKTFMSYKILQGCNICFHIRELASRLQKGEPVIHVRLTCATH